MMGQNIENDNKGWQAHSRENYDKYSSLQLQQLIIHLKSELALYQAKLREYEKDTKKSKMMKLKTEINELQIELEELYKMVKIKNEENNLLYNQVNDLKNELQQSKNNYDIKFKNIKSDKEKLHDRLWKIKNENKEYIAINQSLNENNELLNRQIEEIQKEIVYIEQCISDSKQTIKQLIEKKNEDKITIANLNKNIDDFKHKETDYHEEIGTLSNLL